MKLLVYHARAETYRALLRERFPDLDVATVVAGADEAALERHLADAEVLLGWRIPVAALARAPAGSAGSSSPARAPTSCSTPAPTSATWSSPTPGGSTAT